MAGPESPGADAMDTALASFLADRPPQAPPADAAPLLPVAARRAPATLPPRSGMHKPVPQTSSREAVPAAPRVADEPAPQVLSPAASIAAARPLANYVRALQQQQLEAGYRAARARGKLVGMAYGLITMLLIALALVVAGGLAVLWRAV